LQRSQVHVVHVNLLPNRPTLYNDGRCTLWTLRSFAAPHSHLKRSALRFWKLNSRFAARSVPKPQLLSFTDASWKYSFNASAHCLYREKLMLIRSNCPVLDAQAKPDAQTALVLLDAWQRHRIRRRAPRALPLDPRTSWFPALSRHGTPLVELAIIALAYHQHQVTEPTLIWVHAAGDFQAEGLARVLISH
jgi:hypothetical protein